MKVDKETLSKILYYSKRKWQPLSLVVLILVSLIITITIPPGSKKSMTPTVNYKNTNASSSANRSHGSSESKNILNLFGLLSMGNKTQNNYQNQNESTKPPTVVPNVVNTQTSSSTVTKILADGTKVVQEVDGNTSIATSQGTINPNGNINSNLSGNTQNTAQVDNIRIVFLNPDGTTFTYVPPGTPPDEVRWAIYTNNNDHYSLLYPYNWQFVYSVSNGHEGIALYPPGADPNNAETPRIGFGVTDNFLLPVIGQAQGTYLTPIIVDNIHGGLYTNGPIGNSFIASVFPYSGKFFGLGSSKSDATFAYVYYFMINSLTFNVQ